MNDPHRDGAAAALGRLSPIDWRGVLSEHQRWLRTIVAARLREADAVEEVMQEVALAAVRQASPIADPNRVAPWLYRIAVRQVLLWRRKQGRRRSLVSRFAQRRQTGDADATAADPLDWLLRAERRQAIREALRTLPERDAEILLLKYAENWSYRQIAEHLGVSASAVEARLHRARRRLREALAAREVNEASP